MLIVGLDGSPRTSLLLRAAQEVADRLQDRLVLLSSLEIWELHATVPPELAGWNDGAVMSEAETQLRQVLATAAAALPAGMVANTELPAGAPWQTLIAAAQHHAASLIIVSAHGFHDVLGNTPAQLVAHGETPVLIVRDGFSFDRMVVAHHGKRAALDFALRFGKWSRLILLRAVRVPMQLFAKKAHEIEAALIESAHHELTELRATLPDGVPSEVETRVGRASEAIVDVAKSKDATLIVMGRGANAARVLAHTDRSLLVV